MLIEMHLVGKEAGSIMVNLNHISEVVELEGMVRIHMVSGNDYQVTAETFAAALNAIEDFKYLKIKIEDDEEVAKPVEGELV